MIKALGRWWRHRCREIDRRILWSELVRIGGSVEAARNLFFHHCMSDPAWVTDYNPEEIFNMIDEMGREPKQ